jgi:lipoprotein NlpD
MVMSRVRCASWCALALMLQACATQTPAPIEAPGQKKPAAAVSAQLRTTPAAKASSTGQSAVKNGRYTVQGGDTLHAIAWRLGVDHRKIIEWNGLRNPDRIMVGQSLIVAPPPGRTAGVSASPAEPAPKAAATPAPALAVSPAPTAGDARARWVWPAEGKARRSVSATGSSGLQIRGERGQTVRAAAAGEVVYSGSGLRGYGQLLILKHDEIYLSAYAHNDKLLVNEGQRVERGQAIALMGDSGASEVMLHFEIRQGGKAVDPTAYLPVR